jgi:hypothetical protein
VCCCCCCCEKFESYLTTEQPALPSLSPRRCPSPILSVFFVVVVVVFIVLVVIVLVVAVVVVVKSLNPY